jgi:hypothetical protein
MHSSDLQAVREDGQILEESLVWLTVIRRYQHRLFECPLNPMRTHPHKFAGSWVPDSLCGWQVEETWTDISDAPLSVELWGYQATPC